MSRYQAYAEYKDSGVEWLGQIPSHWDVLQSRRMFAVRSEPAWQDDRMLTASQKLGVLYQSDFVELEGRRVAEVILGVANLKHVEPNDFIISMRSFQGGIEWCTLRGSTSFHYVMLKPLKHVVPMFFAHALKSNSYIHALRQTSDLIRDGQELRFSNFTQVPLPVIPDDEQIKIAEFLDHEKAKIDLLIEKQQSLIALLKEKRQAVISHAVTKGLNPNAPMKDSGVEWLGEVPEHWDVKRIKHFGRVIGGYAFKSDDFIESGAKTIKISNVSHLNFDWSDSSFLPVHFLESKKEYIPPKGSLIFAMTRPVISGGVKVAKFDLDEKFLVNQRVGFLKPNPTINQDYLTFVAQSKSFFCAFENNTTATNQPNISAEGIEDIRFACPDLMEQDQVVNYIKKILNLIEAAVGKINLQLELLNERRTALISAAVTGKIDVRDWRAA